MITIFAEIAGVEAPHIASLPRIALRAAGLVSPTVRSLKAIEYQVDRPFVFDSSKFTEVFRVAPTSTRDALRETVASWTTAVAA
jgi:hypothetical protein